MRDRQAYIDAGRNDPGKDKQMQEHPYDFVSLPDTAREVEAIPHNERPEDRWSGELQLIYRTETPLHVGSGVFESAAECGLKGNEPVRGIVRSLSGPVLPGSSWKGAIRSRFEAITRSRLALAETDATEEFNQFPRKLRPRAKQKQQLKIVDSKVVETLKASTVDSGAPIPRLSPAEALFGCMGYRGRVLPGEGRIEGGKAKQALNVPSLNSPRMHRIAKPDGLIPNGFNRWKIERVEGRKFYYDGEVISKKTDVRRSAFERIDYVDSRAEIHIDIRVQSLSPAELGALLIACGHGERVGIVRFGGYKGVGLGKVSLVTAEARLRRGLPMDRLSEEEVDFEKAVEAAQHELIDPSALDELHQVTTAWRKG